MDAQQRESVKAGKKKFGLLGRGSGAANKAPAPRSSEDEQGHLVMSHTAKVCMPLSEDFWEKYTSM